MLNNKAQFNFEDIRQLFSKEDTFNFASNWSCNGISIDTRTIEKGNLFVPIKGEQSDGHQYIHSAIEKGATAVLICKEYYSNYQPLISNFPHIIVNNTLNSLAQLAQYHRRRFDIPIIAIGGSNGKTTTKEMTAHILSQKYKVLKTYKNFNNQLGLPIMLFQLDKSYDMAVLELGTNEPGEMSILSKIAEPNFGLITNIGKEHLEKLIDLDGVELEETFLYGWLHKSGGLAFINMEDERLQKYYNVLENKFTYSISYLTNVVANINLDEFIKPKIDLSFENRHIQAKLQTYGYPSALNAIAASSVAFYFGLNDEELLLGLESYKPEKWHNYGRMYIEKINNFTLINDCYNANPSSMKMALDLLKNYKFKGEKIAILGDMRELGESSYEEHKQLIEYALNSADIILLYGKETQKAFLEYANNNKLKHFTTHQDLANYLLNIKEEALVLLKGSRGMKMEEILTFI